MDGDGDSDGDGDGLGDDSVTLCAVAGETLGDGSARSDPEPAQQAALITAPITAINPRRITRGTLLTIAPQGKKGTLRSLYHEIMPFVNSIHISM